MLVTLVPRDDFLLRSNGSSEILNGFTILSIETSFCFIFLTVMSCFKEFTEVFTWLEDCKLDLFEKVVPF